MGTVNPSHCPDVKSGWEGDSSEKPGDLPESLSTLVNLHGFKVQRRILFVYYKFPAQLCMLLLFSYNACIAEQNVIANSSNTVDSSANYTNADRAISSENRDTAAISYLEKMFVSANRMQRLMETAHSLSVVKADQWAGTGKTIADVISGQSGVHTRRYGGTGSMQTVSIRGIPGSRIQVFVDGVALNSSMGGAVDLGKLNPERFESIEIHKGITPSSFGGNGIGGVVNLRTKRPTPGENGTKIMVSGGSYGLLESCIDVFRHFDTIATLGAYLSYKHAKNTFPYLDRNNTVTITSDDQIRYVNNGEYTNAQGGLTGDYWLNNSSVIRCRLEHTRISGGIPAEESKENVTAGYTQNCTVGDIRIVSDKKYGSRMTLEPRMNFEIKTGETHSTGLDHFSHPHGTLTSGDYIELGYRDIKANCALQLNYKPCVWWSLNALMSITGEDFDPFSSKNDSIHGEWPGRRVQGSFSTTLDFLSEKTGLGLELEGAIEGIYTQTDGGVDSYFKYSVPDNDTTEMEKSWRAGLRWTGITGCLLFANLGSYYKIPSLHERYGSFGAVLPNPDLATESGQTIDCGIKLNLSRCYVEIIGFYNLLKNGIYVHNDGRYLKSRNIGGANVYGIEANVALPVIKYLEFENHLTIQRTENSSDISYYKGLHLPGEPPVINEFMTRIGPWYNFDLQYLLEFHSACYRDFKNVQRVPADITKKGLFFNSFRLRWYPSRGFSLAVSANNITMFNFSWKDLPGNYENAKTHIVYPGREYRLTLEYQF